MRVWVDAQLSPRIAQWLSAHFAVEATPVRDLGLREASDERIFDAASAAGSVGLTTHYANSGMLPAQRNSQRPRTPGPCSPSTPSAQTPGRAKTRASPMTGQP